MTAIIDTHPDGGFIATVDGNQVGPRADTLGEAIATACYMLRGPLSLTPAARAHTPHHGKTDAEAIELLARTMVEIEAAQGSVLYSHLYQLGWPPAAIDRLTYKARIRAEQIKAARGADSTGRAA